MSWTDSDFADFRSRAAQASEAARRALPRGVAPAKSGISYCQVREPSLSRLRAPIKATAIVCGVLGLTGLATGPILGVLWVANALAWNRCLPAIALCCFFGGMLLLLVPTLVERSIVRRYLSRGDPNLAPGSELEGIHVAVEDAATYGSMKLLAEDVGLIYIYPEAHYVEIDGLSYEYVIQSKDVLGLKLHSKGKTVLLSYAVDKERLDLAIVPRSINVERQRQREGSSPGLFLRIKEALEPVPE